MIGKCGHQIDAWWGGTNTICKPCFESQGFQYNENSYRDIERGHRGGARSGMGTPLRPQDTGQDDRAQMKRDCANILNPILTATGWRGDSELVRRRRAAFALIKAKHGIGRSTASMYALEFRTAA